MVVQDHIQILRQGTTDERIGTRVQSSTVLVGARDKDRRQRAPAVERVRAGPLADVILARWNLEIAERCEVPDRVEAGNGPQSSGCLPQQRSEPERPGRREGPDADPLGVDPEVLGLGADEVDRRTHGGGHRSRLAAAVRTGG